MKSEGLIQFIKFGIVGVANTAVDWIVFYLLINTFSLYEPTAKAIAFIVAMLNSYLWNTIWTFKNEYKKAVGKSDAGSAKGKIFSKFAVVSGVGWAINVGVFTLALNNLDYKLFNNTELLPLVLASGAAIVWNFFANKFWTYKK